MDEELYGALTSGAIEEPKKTKSQTQVKTKETQATRETPKTKREIELSDAYLSGLTGAGMGLKSMAASGLYNVGKKAYEGRSDKGDIKDIAKAALSAVGTAIPMARSASQAIPGGSTALQTAGQFAEGALKTPYEYMTEDSVDYNQPRTVPQILAELAGNITGDVAIAALSGGSLAPLAAEGGLAGLGRAASQIGKRAMAATPGAIARTGIGFGGGYGATHLASNALMGSDWFNSLSNEDKEAVMNITSATAGTAGGIAAHNLAKSAPMISQSVEALRDVGRKGLGKTSAREAREAQATLDAVPKDLQAQLEASGIGQDIPLEVSPEYTALRDELLQSQSSPKGANVGTQSAKTYKDFRSLLNKQNTALYNAKKNIFEQPLEGGGTIGELPINLSNDQIKSLQQQKQENAPYMSSEIPADYKRNLGEVFNLDYSNPDYVGMETKEIKTPQQVQEGLLTSLGLIMGQHENTNEFKDSPISKKLTGTQINNENAFRKFINQANNLDNGMVLDKILGNNLNAKDFNLAQQLKTDGKYDADKVLDFIKDDNRNIELKSMVFDNLSKNPQLGREVDYAINAQLSHITPYEEHSNIISRMSEPYVMSKGEMTGGLTSKSREELAQLNKDMGRKVYDQTLNEIANITMPQHTAKNAEPIDQNIRLASAKKLTNELSSVLSSYAEGKKVDPLAIEKMIQTIPNDYKSGVELAYLFDNLAKGSHAPVHLGGLGIPNLAKQVKAMGEGFKQQAIQSEAMRLFHERGGDIDSHVNEATQTVNSALKHKSNFTLPDGNTIELQRDGNLTLPLLDMVSEIGTQQKSFTPLHQPGAVARESFAQKLHDYIASIPANTHTVNSVSKIISGLNRAKHLRPNTSPGEMGQTIKMFKDLMHDTIKEKLGGEQGKKVSSLLSAVSELQGSVLALNDKHKVLQKEHPEASPFAANFLDSTHSLTMHSDLVMEKLNKLIDSGKIDKSQIEGLSDEIKSISKEAKDINRDYIKHQRGLGAAKEAEIMKLAAAEAEVHLDPSNFIGGLIGEGEKRDRYTTEGAKTKTKAAKEFLTERGLVPSSAADLISQLFSENQFGVAPSTGIEQKNAGIDVKQLFNKMSTDEGKQSLNKQFELAAQADTRLDSDIIDMSPENRQAAREEITKHYSDNLNNHFDKEISNVLSSTSNLRTDIGKIKQQVENFTENYNKRDGEQSIGKFLDEDTKLKWGVDKDGKMNEKDNIYLQAAQLFNPANSQPGQKPFNELPTAISDIFKSDKPIDNLIRQVDAGNKMLNNIDKQIKDKIKGPKADKYKMEDKLSYDNPKANFKRLGIPESPGLLRQAASLIKGAYVNHILHFISKSVEKDMDLNRNQQIMSVKGEIAKLIAQPENNEAVLISLKDKTDNARKVLDKFKKEKTYLGNVRAAAIGGREGKPLDMFYKTPEKQPEQPSKVDEQDALIQELMSELGS